MDPHRILGVRPGASAEDVRRAFAISVRSIHPDSGGDARSAGERMAALIAARDQLLGGGRPLPKENLSFYRRPTGWVLVGRLIKVTAAATATVMVAAAAEAIEGFSEAKRKKS